MELYEHQKDVLKQTEQLNRVAYYLDMGLGKTFVGAEKMYQLGTKANLLICQKSKIQDWDEHFFKHYAGSYKSSNKKVFISWDLTDKKDFENFFKAINNKEWNTCHVGIINYELAWRRKDLLKLHDFTLMLDESSLIQNRKAKQSKFILKLQPSNVILLSGTPTAGKYENLWTQAHLLGWDISEALYNRQYINWKTQQIGWQNPQYIRVIDKDDPYKNVERLKSKFREHGAVFMKTEDVLTLPEQTFIELNVPSSKEYKYFMENSIVELTGDLALVGDTSLTKRLYARQLCGQYSKDKLEAFRDLISSTNDRLIVFYNFTEELNRLVQICEELNKPISIVNGTTKDLSAYKQKSDSITFCQYQAGAMGLNLQGANKIIYFTLPERSELFEQSKKRIHRIGQNKPCFYYILMCQGTVEENIYETLKQRKDYTDELFKKTFS